MPTSRGTTPYTAREHDEPRPCRRPRASRSSGSADDQPRAACPASPACRRPSRLERLADQARLGRIERLAADIRHLDLVRLAVRDRRRGHAGEELDRGGAPAVAVVELELAVAEDHRRRGRVGDRRRGRRAHVLARARQVRQRLLHERLPDQRRERAALDRLPVELGQHRHELVRVADPDGGHEVAA